ncbi:MAG: hypothetical protein EP320_02030 [Rhodobacteraceae bacterium]|nr:MAG: hypothetical protein EP320_02030 [Paracoccaceae bacterium]
MRRVYGLGIAFATGVALSLGHAHEARADGVFFQVDAAQNTSDTVFSMTRGKVSFGANFSDYEGGWSTGASLSRDFVVDGIGTLKIGPSVGKTLSEGNWRLGAKVAVERYTPTAFGHVFVLAQYNTIGQDWFALFQAGNKSGFGLELSAGGSDTYSERTVAFSKKIGDGPVAIRAGYHVFAEEAFLGFTINTF